MHDHIDVTDWKTFADAGAIFYVSTSGGSDSQAMYIHLLDRIPSTQIVLVHADLGEVEWTGVQEHIRRYAKHPLNVVRANKTLFDMVEHRHRTRPDVPSWPSASHRQCTSDLKRGPIEKYIRNDMKARGATLAVNCMGLRADESKARARKKTFTINKTLSKAGRTVANWLPIHSWTKERTFEAIRDAGQTPHPAYSGNQRLSCVFCIMGSESDLIHGAKCNPELARRYIALERQTGYGLFHKRTLESVVGRYIPIGNPAA